MPLTMTEILYTLARGPLDVEALDFSLRSLYGNQALIKWVYIKEIRVALYRFRALYYMLILHNKCNSVVFQQNKVFYINSSVLIC